MLDPHPQVIRDRPMFEPWIFRFGMLKKGAGFGKYLAKSLEKAANQLM
jgi:hypothetical protein